MNVSERVVVGVPAAEAKIKATNASAMVVDNDDLLVMRPELDVV